MVEVDTAAAPTPRRWRSRGGLVTIATVASLVAGMGLTVLGLGAADQAVASYDTASWVWSRVQGELARINGVTAKVDTRVDVRNAHGHPMQISQTDRFVILRNLTTGQVSSMDLTSLQLAATTPTTAGLGVTVALHDDAAFVVDTVQGVVRQLDPRTLSPIGEPLRFPPGITGGTFDGAGRLWIAAPDQGTVSAIAAAPLTSDAPPEAAAGAATGPQLAQTVTVAAPSHDLTLSTLDAGVAVLDRTTNVLTTVRGDRQHTTELPLTGPGSLPAHTAGDAVPVTVPDDRQVYVVADSGVSTFTVPGDGAGLKPAVAWEGYYYVADERVGTVHVFDGAGRAGEAIDIKTEGGRLELDVRENHLFINAPDASTARVVDDEHAVRVVDKYADDVLGGDPPPTPPTPPKPPKPRKPPVTRPSAPRNVTASAGNAEARVSWRPAAANGAEITRYVVEGDGRTFKVGARQRSVLVTGLTNGNTYRFSVHAVNAKGAGPSRTSNPVRPTAEVPDAPETITAAARPDGTVQVSWAKANGQGRKIRKYQVSAISEGGSAPIGDAKGTELIIKDKELAYGTQYAFTVVAVNDRGAGSKPSPVSESVVPFTVPGRPDGVDARTVGGKAGAVQVVWSDAAENGRAITKYVVKANGKTVDVIGNSTTMTGFGNGTTVAVEVRAVNEAGPGEPGTATARTVSVPKVTVTGVKFTQTAATATMTVDAGGGTATCTMAVSGAKSKSGACRSLTVSGLKPSTSYTVTVTPKNAAGKGAAVKKTGKTGKVLGKSVCVNNTDSSDPAQHTWCNDTDNAMHIMPRASMNGSRLGRGKNSQQFEAICKTNGEGINDYVYNPGKMGTSPNDSTRIWIRLKYKDGTGYMSFAWFNLNGLDPDSTGPLPNC
ncbi:MAG TPA: fibronectin type III domain-containing protein [Actinoplanes sp.]|nr:fibronectin type III domain-containing protein [Actinoplanes sp.]